MATNEAREFAGDKTALRRSAIAGAVQKPSFADVMSSRRAWSTHKANEGCVQVEGNNVVDKPARHWAARCQLLCTDGEIDDMKAGHSERKLN